MSGYHQARQPIKIPGSAQSSVAFPSIFMMVTAIVGIIVGLLQAAGFSITFFVLASQNGPPRGDEALPVYSVFGGATLVGLIGAFTSVVVLFGAISLKRLKSRSFVILASILCLLPICSPCLLIGVPAGIISLVALSNPAVKAGFR